MQPSKLLIACAFFGLALTPLPAAAQGTPNQGIIWDETGMEGLAPFQIITEPGSNYYLKLISFESGIEAIGIFVIGGQVVEVEIPLGSYELRYATGTVWLGRTHDFGDEATYVKTDSIFHFVEEENGYRGYAIELFDRVDGNLSTSKIEKANF